MRQPDGALEWWNPDRAETNCGPCAGHWRCSPINTTSHDVPSIHWISSMSRLSSDVPAAVRTRVQAVSSHIANDEAKGNVLPLHSIINN